VHLHVCEKAYSTASHDSRDMLRVGSASGKLQDPDAQLRVHRPQNPNQAFATAQVSKQRLHTLFTRGTLYTPGSEIVCFATFAYQLCPGNDSPFLKSPRPVPRSDTVH
jgi:hypothetical protein